MFSGVFMKIGTAVNEEKRAAAETEIRKCGEKWKSGIVARSALGEFSGGLIAPGTAANLDCLKIGIPGRFIIGRQNVYPVASVVEWLINRLEV